MNAEPTIEEYGIAADLAEMAEAVAFSGNDLTALRNGIAGDSEIQMFVDYVVAMLRKAKGDTHEQG